MGAGYSGNPGKGFIARAAPKSWEYKPFHDPKAASISELQSILQSGSAAARLSAQQELLNRSPKKAAKIGWELCIDKSLPLYARVAGMYTYAQAAGKDGIKKLVELTSDKAMSAFALRAITDRKPFIKEVPIEPFMNGLKDASPQVQIAAIIGLGRLGSPEATEALLQIPVPASFVSPPQEKKYPHATPNTPHHSRTPCCKSPVALNAVDACIAAIGSGNSTSALWALR